MAYYCTECDKMHRRLSGIGVRHKEYEGEKPTRITVRPDRSAEGYTGISISGEGEIESWTGTNTDSFTITLEPAEPISSSLTLLDIDDESFSDAFEHWGSTVPPWDDDEAASTRPSTFTESLVDDLKAIIKSFPPIPYTHTPQELYATRGEQGLWLRRLKDLIQME